MNNSDKMNLGEMRCCRVNGFGSCTQGNMRKGEKHDIVIVRRCEDACQLRDPPWDATHDVFICSLRQKCHSKYAFWRIHLKGRFPLRVTPIYTVISASHIVTWV
ncbi:hypothetical protein POVCU2_0048220 [Plasmodium ovale curtisi]|uniref:Uncharacterized protein n=1 Tax=Plasmodium ovale curtisi TaxID=864141 RepID=A0A1A8X245_PLAOA|nr:hypothetical protein POVCU2_0048220 [Plasmodium ovale curtisi]SBS98231.1 hypothetical protein POVCU1_044520 [Plasmodium ovale curtisi]